MTQLLDPPRQHQRPPVDPRFRRRWAEARREEGRRRLRALLVVVGLIALVGGAIGLLHTSVFAVRHVSVVGNQHTPRTEIVAAAGLSGEQALMVDSGSPAAVRAVERLPWVGTVSFARHWPWSVAVIVHERKPAAIVPVPGALDVVDRTGRVLEALTVREPVPSLPVVGGARGAPLGRRVSSATGTTRAQLGDLLAAAAATPAPLAKRDFQLTYSPALGLVGYLGPAKTQILLGDPSQMVLKLAVLEELARRVTISGYAQVDLTVPQRPALTPWPNSGNS